MYIALKIPIGDATLPAQSRREDFYARICSCKAALYHSVAVLHLLSLLQTLEKEFPEPPMLSSDPEKRDATLRACDSTEEFASAGYAFMLGRRMRSNDEDAPEPSQQDLRSEFERQLDELEGLFTQYGGPFIMGCDSLSPHL